jgi:signal transduction histidine kinase
LAAWYVFLGDGIAIVLVLIGAIFLLFKYYNVSFSLTMSSLLASLFFQNILHLRNETFITPVTQIYISIVVMILGMLMLSYFAVKKYQFVLYYASSAGLIITQVVIIYSTFVPSIETPRTFAANLIIPMIDFISAGFFNYFIFYYFQKITGDLEDKNRTIARDNEVLESAVRERTNELERVSDNLKQFAKVSSHDLKEHLRIMTSFMELVERKVNQAYFQDQEMKRFVEFAVESGKRMDDIIDGLLEYIAIDMREDSRKSVDANAIVRAVIEDLETPKIGRASCRERVCQYV